MPLFRRFWTFSIILDTYVYELPELPNLGFCYFVAKINFINILLYSSIAIHQNIKTMKTKKIEIELWLGAAAFIALLLLITLNV